MRDNKIEGQDNSTLELQDTIAFHLWATFSITIIGAKVWFFYRDSSCQRALFERA